MYGSTVCPSSHFRHSGKTHYSHSHLPERWRGGKGPQQQSDGQLRSVRDLYQMPEAQTVVRGSLRYDGNPQLVKALIGMRRLDVEPKDWLRLGITWAHAQQKATSAVSTSESDLMTKIEELCKFRSPRKSGNMSSRACAGSACFLVTRLRCRKIF